MSSSSATIVFGGVSYEVPQLNVGQLEQLSEIEELPPVKRTLATIRIALQRARPAIPAFVDIETDAQEIGAAYARVLTLAGLAKGPEKVADPNEPAPRKKASGHKHDAAAN